MTHWLAAQLTSPLPTAAQALPQPPQLAASDVVFKHAPPHFSNPCRQLMPQAPPEQTASPLATAAQAFPQALQWSTLALVSTQAPLQLVVPLGQPALQLPELHTWEPVHFLPQVPQLSGSAERSAQAAPQAVLPVAQGVSARLASLLSLVLVASGVGVGAGSAHAVRSKAASTGLRSARTAVARGILI